MHDLQLEQDAHFFQSSSPPDNRERVAPAAHRTPPSSNNAAARFYRQNRRRTLSDTSVDSSPGFIDHRRSQASMPVPFRRAREDQPSRSHLSPRDVVRTAARNKSSRLRSEMQSEDRTTHLQDDFEDEPGQSDSAGSDDLESRSPSNRKKPSRPRNNTRASTSGDRSRSDQLDLDAVHSSSYPHNGTEDEPGVLDHRSDGERHRPRSYLQRHQSGRSTHSQYGGRNLKLGLGEADDGDTFTPSLSRRPSDVGKVEEDVCFPMLEMREADMEEREGGARGGRRSPSREERHDVADSYREKHHGMGIPGVLPNFPFPFDFGALEEYCDEEREKNGIPIPRSKRGVNDGTTAQGASADSRLISFSPEQEGGMMRRRMNGEVPLRKQRKLSESVGHGVGRYQRKLALFEGGTTSAGEESKSITSPAHVKTPLLSDAAKGGSGFGAIGQSAQRSGYHSSEKARPYRFSFYSNALPTTIHARSLAEIPGDGQTFEELFVGRHTRNPPEEWEASVIPNESHANDAFLPARPPGASSSGKNTPDNSQLGGAVPQSRSAGGISNMARFASQAEKPRTSVIRSNEDAEANTWWLDILSPTDAEMKVLAKVFGIHPLTIEDILMEETREKIELFRNYYLVCFRSFDQDPYSPTHLEPLNMYIIVFREGTLSFHFRGTPHPQNVRRRIKQLKDFINVTSDWISYALIDDITDAFGPLIQNIEYEVDSIDELVLILKDAEQSDMLRRIGTCRKKVMGLLRLMGNKADVVKGLAKRCNENWSVAPKSDIGLYLSDIQVGLYRRILRLAWLMCFLRTI